MSDAASVQPWPYLLSVRLVPERFPTAEHYPFSLPLLRQTQSLALDAPVTILVGENGTGKSTLLEAIARRAGIHIWREGARPRLRPNPYEGLLHRCLEVCWADGPVPGAFFSSQSHREFSEMMDEMASLDPGQLAAYGGESLVTRSHGESCMAYFRNRYRLRGLYLLDEPETALSPRRQLELLEVLAATAHAGGAQFILATHSPILLACPGARVYSLDEAPPRIVDWHQTGHWQTYREFFANPEPFLRRSPS